MTITDQTTARKSVTQLTDQEFDLLVIGAGIYGSALACRAARAGLKVALIEKGDYGEGASANSLKILHGGLRYLQQADFARMRESIKARRDGMASLPHLTHPAPFMAPSGSSLKRSRTAFRVASVLNDAISLDRNKGVRESHALPNIQVLSKEEVAALIPNADIPGNGAMLWCDGFIENTERYTLAYVMTAKDLGAVTANYVRATGLLQSGTTISGAAALDEETGNAFNIRAKFTVNATGPWIADLVPAGSNVDTPSTWVRAYNIVVNRNWFGKYGIGLDNRERNFFFAPWRGGTIIGTVYDIFRDHADACKLTSNDIAAFVDDVNGLYPKAALSIDDVTFAHVGVMPGKTNKLGRSINEPSGETKVIDYGVEGFLTLLGVKYTTGAFWADKVTDTILHRLGKKDANKSHRLYGSDSADWQPSTPDKETVERAVREEDAIHLTDVLLRRTDLGTFASPDADCVTKISDFMKELLGWSDEMKESEISNARDHYARLGIRAAF